MLQRCVQLLKADDDAASQRVAVLVLRDLQEVLLLAAITYHR